MIMKKSDKTKYDINSNCKRSHLQILINIAVNNGVLINKCLLMCERKYISISMAYLFLGNKIVWQ